jgi:ABC-2 type transport system permease protein
MKIFSSRALALMRKELYQALYSPATYGIALFFLLFVSIWLFHLQRFFTMDTATLRPFFAAFPLALSW